MAGPRDYKRAHIRRLDTLSGNECAEPTCIKPLIAEDGISIVSKICHIEAASENGPRYNSNMTDDERRHYNNLILLCDEHHVIIDNKENEKLFPTPLLKDWKNNHEAKNRYKLRHTSLLKQAIEAIADIEVEMIDKKQASQDLASFNIEDKIPYNDIKRNKFLIEEYKVFYTKVNSIYQELESQGSFKKDKLLRNINLLYLKAKGKYVQDSDNPMKIIRENSDNIIEDIEEELLKQVEKSVAGSYQGDISFGLSIILVDSFMRCKILEEPPKS